MTQNEINKAIAEALGYKVSSWGNVTEPFTLEAPDGFWPDKPWHPSGRPSRKEESIARPALDGEAPVAI